MGIPHNTTTTLWELRSLEEASEIVATHNTRARIRAFIAALSVPGATR
jgi:hypothetical protein